MRRIKVLFAGATGKMGKVITKGLMEDPEVEIVGAVGKNNAGRPLSEVIPGCDLNLVVLGDLRQAIEYSNPHVLLDFTNPYVVKDNAKLAVENDIRPVIGTTGLNEDDVAELQKLCQQKRLGGVIAPNFAIGAVLMIEFAKVAAGYFDSVELIERHHEKKLDAPSGTAATTAALLEEKDNRDGERYKNIPIHSVRLPGLVAEQQVLFGGRGETLSIEHRSIDRECFIPGVLQAIRKAMELDHLVYGMQEVLGLTLGAK